MSYYLFRRGGADSAQPKDWYAVGRTGGYSDYADAEKSAKEAATASGVEVAIMELKALVNLVPVVAVQPPSEAVPRDGGYRGGTRGAPWD